MSDTPTSNGHGKPDWPRCEARTHQGGEPCRMSAGWGTDHVGIGRCKLHGGSTPDHRKHANGQKAAAAVVTFGLPREIDPQTALLEEVHRTAGHVAYLAQVVAELEHADLKQLDMSEKFEKPAVWVEMYQAERKHLTKVAATCISAGIAERQVRIAETMGQQLAATMRAILDDYASALIAEGLAVDVLQRVQRDALPSIVRRRLAEVVAVGP